MIFLKFCDRAFAQSTCTDLFLDQYCIILYDAEKIDLESGIWIDGYNCIKREEMIFAYGKKTLICAVY